LFLKAAGTVVLIGSSLKSNHHKQIYLSRICEMLCIYNTSCFFAF